MGSPLAYFAGGVAAFATLALVPLALSLALRALGGLGEKAAAEPLGAEAARHARWALAWTGLVLVPIPLLLDATHAGRTAFDLAAGAVALAAFARAWIAGRSEPTPTPYRLLWAVLEAALVLAGLWIAAGVAELMPVRPI
ncbi:MAG: hypothetical protein U0X73_05545 [Thermoanaerobaculia bacterium]